MTGNIVKLTIAVRGSDFVATYQDDTPTHTFKGRTAWALCELIRSGERGITSLENPAPRLSDYIHKLRKAGLVIDTEDEKHAPPFAGTHGRYRLRSPVTVIEEVRS